MKILPADKARIYIKQHKYINGQYDEYITYFVSENKIKIIWDTLQNTYTLYDDEYEKEILDYIPYPEKEKIELTQFEKNVSKYFNKLIEESFKEENEIIDHKTDEELKFKYNIE